MEGGRRGKHISTRTVRATFKHLCLKTGIKEYVTVHSLKHSFATHLLESGVYLRYIQDMGEHKSSKTTEIYTHVSEVSIVRIKSPLDDIVERGNMITSRWIYMRSIADITLNQDNIRNADINELGDILLREE